ncbi:MAG TPA: hypothetical protein EYP10_00210, partial [Armatimonadetes bacterium]|nr:hypothetical protein [Armatimonadota bacterium]
MIPETTQAQSKGEWIDSHRNEWRWAITFAFIFVALTWLPYLMAYAIVPSGMHYFWLLGNPDDQNVHLMWARQAADGAWRFKDLYTTESHPGMFVHSLMLAIGWLHRGTRVPLHLLYQFTRSVAAFGLCLTAYALARSCIATIPARRLFVLILCFSSGFGWFTWLCRSMFNINLPLLVDVSPELMMPEAITFLAGLVAPLAITGMALATGIMACMMQFTRTHHFKFVAYSVILAMLLGNVHTYVAVALVAVFAVWWVFHIIWCAWLQHLRLNQTNFTGNSLTLAGVFIVVALAGALGALPQWLAFRADPAFRMKALTPTLTPPVWILCASYGFITLLALIGIGIAVRTRWHALPMALGWIVGIAISIYLPVSFQRKMIEGLHIPLCLLAAYAC